MSAPDFTASGMKETSTLCLEPEGQPKTQEPKPSHSLALRGSQPQESPSFSAPAMKVLATLPATSGSARFTKRNSSRWP